LKHSDRRAVSRYRLSSTYTEIGNYVAVTSKSGGGAKDLQKTAHVQSGVTMTTSQAQHAICKDKRLDGIVQQLGQYQLLESSCLELSCQDDPDGTSVFETHHRSIKSGTNNKTPLFKRLYMALSATQKAWEHTLKLIVVDGTFMKAHIFDQTVLLAVYESTYI